MNLKLKTGELVFMIKGSNEYFKDSDDNNAFIFLSSFFEGERMGKFLWLRRSWTKTENREWSVKSIKEFFGREL